MLDYNWLYKKESMSNILYKWIIDYLFTYIIWKKATVKQNMPKSQKHLFSTDV